LDKTSQLPLDRPFLSCGQQELSLFFSLLLRGLATRGKNQAFQSCPWLEVLWLFIELGSHMRPSVDCIPVISSIIVLLGKTVGTVGTEVGSLENFNWCRYESLSMQPAWLRRHPSCVISTFITLLGMPQFASLWPRAAWFNSC
jgi:hypothetical protein